MIQGTTSDAGKSTVVTALCRWLHKKGVKVAPFKPQNMALNSAVTEDGGEIGRAQAVQAQACGLPPHTDFNPILLKPTSDVGAQIIVHGKAIDHLDAVEYHDYKTTAMNAVLESHQRLCEQYDVIVVEGAGSPAEINLRDRDIANMGFAEAVDCPVIIVADIDKGGVFAQLVGTLELLSRSEQERVVGFIINRFRGDIKLLEPGLTWLEERTGKPVLGVLPFLNGLHIAAEDALTQGIPTQGENTLKVIVPALPRISNHNDFDPLRLHPQVDFEFIGPEQTIPPADLIILPGSKSVISDYRWLLQNGWEDAIEKHLRYGGKLMGICGGFQMLGHAVRDPEHIEGTTSSQLTLGLLDIETTLAPEKVLKNRQGRIANTDILVKGYEIHAGITTGQGLTQPALLLQPNEPDGAISQDKNVMGFYLHGIFDHPEALNKLLNWAGLYETRSLDIHAIQEKQIDRLANCIEQHLDILAVTQHILPQQ